MREIPFSDVILAATGKRVLPIEPKNPGDQRMIKPIDSTLDEVRKRMNAPDGSIQSVPRINDVSSHFENLLRELLNASRDSSATFHAPRRIACSDPVILICA